MKAPYTSFSGTTVILPVRVRFNNESVESPTHWDEELWIERDEDWYALMSPALRNKYVRVVERKDFLRAKAFS